MRARNIIKNNDGTYNIVYFGSAGLEDASTGSPEEATVYSIAGDNFFCGEFPYSVCGITNIESSGGVITKITITSTYDRLTNQNIQLTINTTDTVNIMFKDEDDNVLYTNTIHSNTTIQTLLTQPSEGKITLELTGAGITPDKMSSLRLFYYYGTSVKRDTYVQDSSEMVSKSLTQRLSAIRGELWYDINYGLPLFDKIRDKAILDMEIMEIINNHPAVVSIEEYKSEVDKREYSFKAKIISIYNKSFEISSNYLL